MTNLLFRALPFAAVVLVALTVFPAQATIGVIPIRMTLDARAPLNLFTITNDEDVPKLIKASLFRWSHEAGTDKLTPSTDVLISPPVFTIPPHERQVIRVISRKRAADAELAYRVLIEETPVAANGRVGMSIAMHVSIPVFVAPSSDEQAKVAWSLKLDANRHYVIALDNTSKRHVHVIRVALSDGKTPVAAVHAPTYVFAGERSEWTLLPAKPVSDAKTLTLDVQTDGGDVKQPLKVSQ